MNLFFARRSCASQLPLIVILSIHMIRYLFVLFLLLLLFLLCPIVVYNSCTSTRRTNRAAFESLFVVWRIESVNMSGPRINGTMCCWNCLYTQWTITCLHTVGVDYIVKTASRNTKTKKCAFAKKSTKVPFNGLGDLDYPTNEHDNSNCWKLLIINYNLFRHMTFTIHWLEWKSHPTSYLYGNRILLASELKAIRKKSEHLRYYHFILLKFNARKI